MSDKDTDSFLEKRRAKRIAAPDGTTVLLRWDNGPLGPIDLMDISVAGMLICNYNNEKMYPVNSLINDIIIDIPPCELSNNSKIWLLINYGKVVRSFVDEVSKTSYYGIELIDENPYVKEKIASLVNNSKT